MITLSRILLFHGSVNFPVNECGDNYFLFTTLDLILCGEVFESRDGRHINNSEKTTAINHFA